MFLEEHPDNNSEEPAYFGHRALPAIGSAKARLHVMLKAA
jgi:hypothetical protein